MDEVAEGSFRAGGERAECGGVLPGARGMRSAVFRVEETAEAGGGRVRGSESGGKLAGVDGGARRGD